MQEDEARKYTENSRMVAIQAQLTERALELLVRTCCGCTLWSARCGLHAALLPGSWRSAPWSCWCAAPAVQPVALACLLRCRAASCCCRCCALVAAGSACTPRPPAAALWLIQCPQALPEDGTPKLLLDLGCGSGLSGEALSERGHIWVVSEGEGSRGE